ncbi:MAG: hypothetical protein HY598_03565 [Candidatus Omnitrophica bacterium]|nr:hypothetical protein [Candidatus Omnitrophota bacterium]
MPVSDLALRSDQEYRRWLTRFASRVLTASAGGVLILSGTLLQGQVDLGKLMVLVGCALALALLIRLVPWYRVAPAWFLLPTVLTALVTLALLRISGGIASPFRLLPAAVLLFTVAYFEGVWLIAGAALVIGGALTGLVGISRSLAVSHRSVEALCLLLLAVIGARTIATLRKQRRKISQLNERIQQQRAQLIEATKTQTIMELAGGVAHELNQPLTVLLAESERLQRAPALPPALKEPLAQCFQEAQRASRIIQRLQELTTHTTGPYVGGVTISTVMEKEALEG